MAASSRRSLGDLAGLGVHLAPSQVALLDQEQGCAMVCWNIPDPWSYPLEGFGTLGMWKVDGRDKLWNPVQIPLCMEFRKDPDPDDRIETEWPALNGYVDFPGRYDGDGDEISSFPVWMGWPITPEQCDRLRGIVWHAWEASPLDELAEYYLSQNAEGLSEAELIENHPGLLDQNGNMKISTELAAVAPQLVFRDRIDDDLYTAWYLCRESARRGWRAMELSALANDRPALRRLQREVIKWF